MPAAGSGFPGVNYNDKKIDQGKGELMLMKNFPSSINSSSRKEEVKNYLKAISNANTKLQKPQFHAMVSTKFQKHSKEELTMIADNFMKGMGYGKQPYIIVFHNDTDNNHVHLISTRVQKETGKKVNDSYEKLKSQKVLTQVMEKLYGINLEEKLKKLLSYKIYSINQLEILLERNGFKMVKNKHNENQLDIFANGIKQKSISAEQLKFDLRPNEIRLRQIKAILIKYKEIYSNKVFAVKDNRKAESMLPVEKLKSKEAFLKTKVEYESELQKKLRDIFGLDLVFHQKDNLKPFGYTIIDHKNGQIYKGSQIIKLNDLFEFTSAILDKKIFEVLKDYNIYNAEMKVSLLEFLNKRYPDVRIEDFMLFENKGKKDLETYRKVQMEVKDYLFNVRTRSRQENIYFVKNSAEKVFAIHTRCHYIGDLKGLIGEKEYERFLENGGLDSLLTKYTVVNNESKGIKEAIDEMLFEMMKTTGLARDPFENDRKKKRKKRK